MRQVFRATPCLLFCLMLSLMLAVSGRAQSSFLSLEEFQAAYDQSSTPEEVAALFVRAMAVFTRDQDQGQARFTMLLTPAQIEDGDVYDGKQPGKSFRYLLGQLEKKPYTAWSYISGATPGNGYAVEGGEQAWQVELKPDGIASDDPDRVKFFVYSSGADSPRPIRLKKNTQGKWKVEEASSLFVGVRPPEE